MSSQLCIGKRLCDAFPVKNELKQRDKVNIL
jgi:hypothetical protein